MKVQFNGAAGEVGKSCFSLTTGEKTIFLDCGLKMAGGDKPMPSSPSLEKIKRPEIVLLSHAHLDHCGAVPELYKHSAPITYCTTPTMAVCQILYEDTLKIAKQEKMPSPFSKQDLQKAEKHFSALGYENEFSLSNGVKFSFHDAGHILGSAQILVKTEGKKLLYTGDFKLRETRMHAGAKIVEDKIDLLVMESTYAEHEQPDRKKIEKQFFNEVQNVVDEGGVVLLPCFAVGRTQEILSILAENNLKGDIYLQGMGTKVNQLYHDYPNYVKNPKSLNAALKRATQIESREEREAALEGGSVVIATAGMLEGGPAVGFIQEMEKLQKIPTAIFLTGFQVPGTNGYKLMQGKKITVKNEKNSSQTFQVTSAVKLFEFSAHADKTELYEFVKKVNPEKVVCVHGDEGSCESLAAGLKEEGFEALAPELGEKMEI